MGQYVDIVKALSNETNETGAKELQEHLLKVKQAYLPRFQSIRQQLQSQYTSTSTFNNLLTIEERASQAKKYRAQIYASSKGGAGILPFEEYYKEQQSLLKEKESPLNSRLKALRNQAYTIANENNYKILSGKLMALIYSLKSQLTGIEEKFVFVYSGDSGYAETVTIPVTEFLSNSQILTQMELQVGSILKWSGADDNALRFSSSVLSQIKKMHTSDNDLLANGLERGRQFLYSYNTLRDYGTYEQVVEGKKGYAKLETAKRHLEKYASNENYGLIYRIETGKYYVVNRAAKYERGFIVQGLLGREIGDNNATFIGDNRVFYKDADIKDASGQEYSVKAFLDGQIPSLVTIGTLYNVSSDIISALSQTDNQIMGEKLTTIFNVTKIPLEKIDALANQDIEKVLYNILTG